MQWLTHHAQLFSLCVFCKVERLQAGRLVPSLSWRSFFLQLVVFHLITWPTVFTEIEFCVSYNKHSVRSSNKCTWYCFSYFVSALFFICFSSSLTVFLYLLSIPASLLKGSYSGPCCSREDCRTLVSKQSLTSFPFSVSLHYFPHIFNLIFFFTTALVAVSNECENS